MTQLTVQFEISKLLNHRTCRDPEVRSGGILVCPAESYWPDAARIVERLPVR